MGSKFLTSRRIGLESALQSREDTMGVGGNMRIAMLASALMGSTLAAQAAQAPVGRIGQPNPRSGAFLNIYDTPDIHIATAGRIAGNDLRSVFRLCGTVEVPPVTNNTAEPAKIFDNLYWVGIPSVSAWAITTSEGIIVIDSLDNAKEAETYIEGGLRKLGLDPAQIKYVVITHAHTDHYGGAQYLASKFGAILVMSQTDWDVLARAQAPANPNLNRGPIPRRGTGVPDGFRLSLGGTAVEMVETPPHTPGAISLIFEVRDNGARHVAGLWGSIGFNFQQTQANYTKYADSVEKYENIAKARGVDTPLANHPNFDLAMEKIAALKSRGAGAPHPFVTGRETQARIFDIQTECALAGRAKLRAE
jgi:metallo-beta-lactamase class B